MGVSEVTDSLTIVVSEETGRVIVSVMRGVQNRAGQVQRILYISEIRERGRAGEKEGDGM